MNQKATQIPQNLQTIKFQINSVLESEKKQSRKPSEILPTLLGYHQEYLMGHMAWWRPFGLEAELEMADDPVDGCGIFQELKTFIKKIEVSESFKKLVVSFILTIHGCKLLFYETALA